MLSPTVRIDAGNWLRGQMLLSTRSKTLPSESLARAVAFVVKDARDHTPFVTVGQIDTELSVTVTPTIGARGKPLKNKKTYLTTGLGQRHTPDEHPTIPLTWLIIGARARPGSNYNQVTGQRWQITGGHPYKGHSVSEFGAIMAGLVDKMTKGRHSGSHFFQATWGPVLAALVPLMPARYQGYFTRISGRAARDIGRAQLRSAGASATLQIENRVGMSGAYPNYDRQVNEAAHRVLVPVLQSAIDRNYHAQMSEIAKRGLIDLQAPLRALGYVVS